MSARTQSYRVSDIYFWPSRDLRSAPTNVCSTPKSRQHMLIVSSSAFDPNQTCAPASLQYPRECGGGPPRAEAT